MGQPGFFDAEKRLAALSKKGDPLEAIAALVPWESFRADIEAVALTPDAERKSVISSACGRPAAAGETRARSGIHQRPLGEIHHPNDHAIGGDHANSELEQHRSSSSRANIIQRPDPELLRRIERATNPTSCEQADALAVGALACTRASVL
jgi:hypothetical protein